MTLIYVRKYTTLFCYFVVPVTSSPRRRRRGVFSPKAAKQKWDAIEKNVSTIQVTFDLYQILAHFSGPSWS